MVITNKKSTVNMFWILISLIILSIFCLLYFLLWKIDDSKYYLILSIFLVLFFKRVVSIKYFILEMSDEIISIKYNHPLIKRFVPTSLELPWYKISFCKLRKRTFTNKIYIGVLSNQKIKIFTYDLGLLPLSTVTEIQKSAEKHINNVPKDI